jgi:hypothetical protein
VVSLFGDMTYEGARSITGPYLGLLGAGAATIGIVAGLGEFAGQGLRIIFGYLSDHLRRYWALTILGYAVNLLAVPALALAGRWEIAAALIVTERLGKAIRTPARDAMLASASRSIGRGWAFALHEALDQTGAVTGPLVMSFVLASKRPYSEAFAILLVPAVLALAILFAARIIYPHPDKLDPTPEPPEKAELRGPFRLYLVAAALVAAGYADFALIAYHFQNTGMLADSSIPLLYAGAMGVDALAALFMGRRYDQHGLRALLLPIAVSSLFAPLVFSTQPGLAVVGLACWAVGLGAQESIMRAAVADLVPADRRATGYGIFHGAYGLAWFAGSAVMGSLYAHSLRLLMAFSVLLQLAALPLIVKVGRQQKDIG